MSERVIKLDVLSDFICPWCYIAHRKLERAIEQARSANNPLSFDIQYHPYILHPSLKCDQPISKLEFYEKKKGKNEFKDAMRMMDEQAKREGINLSWGGMIRQTTLAHRLMFKAYRTGGQDMQLKVLLLLFRGYFEEEKDVGCPDVLSNYAVEAGVMESKDEALKFLMSKDLEQDVLKVSGLSAKKGITGVPFTIIDGQWAVSGCQESDVYSKIFKQLSLLDPPSSVLTPKPGAQCPAPGVQCPAAPADVEEPRKPEVTSTNPAMTCTKA